MPQFPFCPSQLTVISPSKSPNWWPGCCHLSFFVVVSRLLKNAIFDSYPSLRTTLKQGSENYFWQAGSKPWSYWIQSTEVWLWHHLVVRSFGSSCSSIATIRKSGGCRSYHCRKEAAATRDLLLMPWKEAKKMVARTWHLSSHSPDLNWPSLACNLDWLPTVALKNLLKPCLLVSLMPNYFTLSGILSSCLAPLKSL